MKHAARGDRRRTGGDPAERRLPQPVAARDRSAASRVDAGRTDAGRTDAGRVDAGRSHRAGRNDAGSSTAEVAVLLPAVAALLLAGLGVGAVGVGQIQLEEGARAAARELARGESPAAATAAARRHVGTGARISVSATGEYSSASISRSIRIPLLGTEVFTLEADAQARTESSYDAR